ncbi:hypothetical protein D3C80_2024230 [compost metagenome]
MICFGQGDDFVHSAKPSPPGFSRSPTDAFAAVVAAMVHEANQVDEVLAFRHLLDEIPEALIGIAEDDDLRIRDDAVEVAVEQ